MTNRNIMKRSLLLFACLSLAGVLLSAPAQAQSCPYTTINVGSYAFHGNGFANHGQPEFSVPAGSSPPVALQGNITFKEDGSISGKQRAAVGGQIGPGATFTGSYTLNSDCSFTVTRVMPCGCEVQWRIEVVNGGAELLFLYLEPDVTLEGSIIKQ